MATDIKTNWMQDFNGDLFAPKTLVESIQNKEGTPLEELLEQGGGGGDASSADKVSYDDTTTQMGVENVQAALEWLKEHGGGSSSSGLISKVLWDYRIEGQNVIKYDANQNYTLNDNINNYDFLVIESVSSSPDLSNKDWNATNFYTIFVKELNSAYNNNYYSYASFNERSSRFYIKDDIFQCATYNVNNTNGLVKIVGYKFGGGNSSNFGWESTYLYNDGLTIASPITLTDNINNYQLIKICFGWIESSTYYGNAEPIYITPKQLKENAENSVQGNLFDIYSDYHIWYNIVDNIFTVTRDATRGNLRLKSIEGINFKDGSSGGNSSAKDEEIIEKEVQSEIITSINAKVSQSSFFRTGFEGYKAFDGNSADPSTCEGGWLAASTDGTPWVSYTFDEEIKLTKMDIEVCNNSGNITKTFKIQGSNDGSTYEDINEISIAFPPNALSNYTFEFTPEKNYKSFRIYSNERNYAGAGGYACTFSQIKIYGYIYINGGEVPAARDISYDDNKTEIGVNNVQEAIEYLKDYPNVFIPEDTEIIENVVIEIQENETLLPKTTISTGSGYATKSVTFLDTLSNFETIDIIVYYYDEYIVTNYNPNDIIGKRIAAQSPRSGSPLNMDVTDTGASNFDCYYHISLEIIGHRKG